MNVQYKNINNNIINKMIKKEDYLKKDDAVIAMVPYSRRKQLVFSVIITTIIIYLLYYVMSEPLYDSNYLKNIPADILQSVHIMSNELTLLSPNMSKHHIKLIINDHEPLLISYGLFNAGKSSFSNFLIGYNVFITSEKSIGDLNRTWIIDLQGSYQGTDLNYSLGDSQGIVKKPLTPIDIVKTSVQIHTMSKIFFNSSAVFLLISHTDINQYDTDFDTIMLDAKLPKITLHKYGGFKIPDVNSRYFKYNYPVLYQGYKVINEMIKMYFDPVRNVNNTQLKIVITKIDQITTQEGGVTHFDIDAAVKLKTRLKGFISKILHGSLFVNNVIPHSPEFNKIIKTVAELDSKSGYRNIIHAISCKFGLASTLINNDSMKRLQTEYEEKNSIPEKRKLSFQTKYKYFNFYEEYEEMKASSGYTDETVLRYFDYDKISTSTLNNLQRGELSFKQGLLESFFE
jgi:hypothetical protein